MQASGWKRCTRGVRGERDRGREEGVVGGVEGAVAAAREEEGGDFSRVML